MAIREQVYTAFYLHGGPGLSAIPEREILGEAAGIYWWDQPRPAPGDSHPYAALIVAAEAEFARKAADLGRPMALVANSFGAHLALHLAHRMPANISAITLLAPVHDSGAGFAAFARRIAESSARCMQLTAAADAYEAAPGNSACFWELVSAIVTTPGFSDHYWSPSAVSRQQWFGTLLTDPAVFDFGAFQVLVDDFLAHPRTAAPSRFSGPVSIVFGRHDPLNDPASAGRVWKEHFPQAQAHVVDAGHLLHLELPVTQWLER